MKLFKKSRKRIDKVFKKDKSVFPHILKDFIKDIEEIWEEAEDFFEDLYASIFHKKSIKIKQVRRVTLYGLFVGVRPAYAFAERIENMLKIVFGVSIFMSGILATFWGFTRTSDLLEALIKSLAGRAIIVIIGISYFLLGVWKLLHIKS
ncbi:hypothetical protein JW930_03635 [Candidatus Woesearchaeota archaeon]|nr:hypothetical protein [Candidatus Woesearchaeota archaeon]